MTVILLVDDDPQVRWTLRRMLEAGEYEVEEATNGKQALELLESGAEYGAVVSDIYMPEMDGVEFLIRVQDSFPGTKVIAISGGGFRSIEGVLSDAQSLGAVFTLEKPVTTDRLLSVVQAALETKDD